MFQYLKFSEMAIRVDDMKKPDKSAEKNPAGFSIGRTMFLLSAIDGERVRYAK